MKLYQIEYIRKFKNLSLPVKAATVFMISSILQRGISMITVPIFTRLLTTEQYGVYSIYQSWYLIIEIFATLNLAGGVFNNGMVKYENDRNRFTSSMQGLSTLVTAIFFVVYLVNMDFWNSFFGLSSLFVLSIIIIQLFIPSYLFWSAHQRYEYKYKSIIVITLVISITSPLLGIFAVLSTTYKAEARVLSYALIQVIIGLIFYIYNLAKGKRIYIKEYWKFALTFNLPLIPHYLSSLILAQVDRIMIGQIISTSKAAVYSIANNIALLMNLFTVSLNNTFIPYTYQALKEENNKKIEKSAKKLIVFVGIMSLIIIAFGPEVVMIFATRDYYDAIWAIPPITFSQYLIFIYSLYCNIEFYYEENRFIVIASVIAAIVNLILNQIFIPIYGFVAAGWTTFFCYLILVITHYFASLLVLKKHKKNQVLYNNKFILLFSISLFGFMLLLLFSYTNTVFRYSIICLILIIGVYKHDKLRRFFIK